MKKYENYTKEQLIQKIKQLESKKYGLVWDDEKEPEKVVIECQNNIPILKKIDEKTIKTEIKKPTNILIEGDNYYALQVLNYTHKGQIDVIYIDPPYNTGNKDFKYNDSFVDKEDGYRHSKWLNFMSKRLKLAHNLLKETGVIFISIDDNEVAQLKLLCDDIFGEKNFVINLIWKTRQASGKQISKNNTSTEHEYVLCYQKEINIEFLGISRDRSSYKNPDNDPRGDWAKHPLDVGSTKDERPNCYYDLIDPKTNIIYKANPNRVWAFAPESMKKLLSEDKIIFHSEGKTRPYLKKFWDELKSESKPISSWLDKETFKIKYNTEGTKELNNIFNGEKVFDYPKPPSLIKTIIRQVSNKNSIILDFFAGSGTTGHAVLELNKEDG